jgi:hypothetical protein
LNTHNKTIKQEPHTSANVDTLQQELDEMKTATVPVHMHSSEPNINQQPKYGCLKNGKLPTYRMTVKNIPSQISEPNIPQSGPLASLSDRRMSLLESRALANVNNAHVRQKQKKIFRRTYNVGKYKSKPQISVLISNKKIRTNITMKLQYARQLSIDKIRKELIKRGLIRVGTITPENVLRQMYESVIMLCGDIKNHNPDNLLYNYFHND